MRRQALLIALIGLALPTGGCITDVCRINSGQAEVTVKFSGFDLSAAESLEVESTIIGPNPAPNHLNGQYYNRRVGTLSFPESARGGSETFVLDPGGYIMGLKDSSERFTWKIVMRVYDGAGRLLAEGTYELDNVKTDGCYLARSMTVSGAQTCDGKQEGDPCVADTSGPRVCKELSDGLTCDVSSCGDGYVDRRQGELCDPALGTPGVQCHEDSCLPAPVSTTLTDGLPQWHELAVNGPPPRDNTAVAVMGPSGSQTAVIFGGVDGNTVLADTWTFNGSVWENVTGGITPPARHNHAMAWDAANNFVILYGGQDGAGDPLGDTWIWDGASWTQDTPTVVGGILQPNYSHAMAWDSTRQVVVLYGGSAGAAQAWEATWNGGAGNYEWTHGTTTTEVRYDHTLTDVPDLGGVVILGGQPSNSNTTVYNDIHLYDGARTELDDSMLDNDPRTAHQAIWSESQGHLVLFGGFDRVDATASNGHFLRSSQTCSATAGSLSCEIQTAPDTPHGRRGHVLFEVNSSIYVFGGRGVRMNGEGYDAPDTLGDTWQMAPTDPKSSYALVQGIQAVPAGESVVPGLNDLGTSNSASATMDRARAMLIADLDGDGRDELALGLPVSACELPLTGPCGRVIIKDHPVGDKTMGQVDKDMVSVIGMSDSSRLNSWLGASLAAGDINNDGAWDLIIGAPRAMGGGGNVYVIFGGEPNLPISASGKTTQIGSMVNYTEYMALDEAGDEESGQPYRLGAAVAVGDFDGDGNADLVASAPLENSDASTLATVYVLFGPGNHWSLGNSPRPITDQEHDHQDENPANRMNLTITSDTPDLLLGYSLATGDLDGDGLADLVVGTAATAMEAVPQYGAVAVIFGNEEFFTRSNTVINIEQLDPSEGVLLAAQDPADRLGGLGGVITMVDLDGDGAHELVASLGRPDRVLGDPSAVALFASADFISYRNGEGTAATLMERATVIEGPVGSGFGASLSTGDTNGDRHPDLIIGAPYQSGPAAAGHEPRPETGALYVVLGSRRADYFALAVRDTSVADLTSVNVATDDVHIPLLIVRGNEHYGFFGTAAATSSHLVTPELDDPHGYTMVYQPGWFDAAEDEDRNKGRIWTLYLAELLGCGFQGPCQLPAP